MHTFDAKLANLRPPTINQPFGATRPRSDATQIRYPEPTPETAHLGLYRTMAGLTGHGVELEGITDNRSSVRLPPTAREVESNRAAVSYIGKCFECITKMDGVNVQVSPGLSFTFSFSRSDGRQVVNLSKTSSEAA